MDEWIKIVSTVGFPIVVAVYLMIRMENTIRILTETLQKLVVALAKKGIDANGDK